MVQAYLGNGNKVVEVLESHGHRVKGQDHALPCLVAPAQ